MFDAIKPLLESGLVNEETRTAINEAWESKLNEAREQIRAELREEMATRYQYDKQVMVEALDKMVTENLAKEIDEFVGEKKAVVEDRVRVKNHMIESAGRFNDFMVNKLAEEIKELHNDRQIQKENYQRLEKFITKALAGEIREFAQDKQAVVEAKVRLVAEAKEKLNDLKARFISNSARLVKESVTTKLGAELVQLKEDIQHARENMFGRRIFEAFASEFSLTHLNENRELQKLKTVIDKQQEQLSEATRAKNSVQKLVESREREIRVIKESAERKEVLVGLLGTLNKEKATVMRELLENVQTEKLKSAFDKYLPAVLNSAGSAKEKAPAILSESRVEFTGDKSAKVTATATSETNVVELRRLAGLK
jgi:predicted DNA-binding protein